MITKREFALWQRFSRKRVQCTTIKQVANAMQTTTVYCSKNI